ncbi:MAG: hypothetical protein COZ46_04495 [Verrucomicrobia bacterium CG_4_10_14_3_um_filter_43_23]|nr:MAG: hypothetical protein AUJ82_05880 [Verrucomicrobia bacterium CG1_02_43_26]PIP60028.1 MAG: hypothetical protein COX01_00255 [Verrucomicrobia bacterium CG22_combo_CG10-13_8_21_14_all_43_17]PIX58312.1 MAG: hypothetical protein COZ46_04495 [Verrucomicrobia bacterium CG_4_10_14_3_um_filter_43_23]PIY62327.1 MAG: hypothetical protein COY94_02290 [Verrucomicrobia bacterium CG_4_10_14_0_8_um_filter_43_34]PJA43774.1 MAG: hypothetical protein CO175_06300 [Verrucomicrobia bacterium CG_4_9_14_3_um_fi
MELNTIASQKFEFCQFVLSDNGIVEIAENEFAHEIGFTLEYLNGKHIKDILSMICHQWAKLLPEDFFKEPSNHLFLPFYNEEGEQLPYGMALRSLMHGQKIYATLSPHIYEKDLLEIKSINELPTQAEIVTQLFLKLQAAESRLNNYVRNFPGVFFVQRPDLSFSYISPTFSKIAGTDINLKSCTWFINLIHEEDVDYYIKETEKNSKINKPFSVSYRLRNPETGSIAYVLDIRTPQISPHGILIEYDGIWVDNTRQAIAESSLSSSAWKTTLATITNGLVHDFSNIMAGIFSISELYFSTIEEGNPMFKGLRQIKKNALDAQQIVQRIIELNRKQSNSRNYYDAEQLIREQLDLIRIILPRHIQLHTEFSGEELPIYTDDVLFRQTILNLAMNASHALGNKHGKVSIKIRRIKAGETMYGGTLAGPRIAKCEGVEISFSDTGFGIPLDHLNKIFHPFFSTKEATKGSGFGLYNAKLYVESNGGFIDVQSVPNEKTTFYIFLPLADLGEDDSASDADHCLIESRPALLAYAFQDPSELEIIEHVRQEGWGIVCFQSPAEVIKYMAETRTLPHVFLAISITNDPNIQDLLEHFKKCYPEVRRTLSIIGSNPEEIPSAIKDSVTFFFTQNTKLQQIIDSLNILVKK